MKSPIILQGRRQLLKKDGITSESAKIKTLNTWDGRWAELASRNTETEKIQKFAWAWAETVVRKKKKT